MSLKDVPLRATYETKKDRTQLLETFYIPVLNEATKYYRIAGYFTSSALVIAAKGIEGLIHNGGKMYLLVSPEITEDDYEIIKKYGGVTEDNHFFDRMDFSEAAHENMQALAWMLYQGKLEIKIVITRSTNTSIFHEKVGIVFDDEGNFLSYSGSINETAQAWLDNIEEFKVFRSWEDGQLEYLQSDLKKFLCFWKHEDPELADVYDLPDSIRKRIIRQKPRDVYDLNIMKRYVKDKKRSDNALSLFPHQKEAVKMWLNNDKSLLMEMATGTGKTRTAIGCIVETLKHEKNIAFIVSTPQNTLSRQWKSDFEKLKIEFDNCIIADGSNRKWRKELALMLLDLSEDRYKAGIVFTTHATSSDSSFIDIVKSNKYNTKIMFICDEVHAAGASKQRFALIDEYDYRVGLSATPERMFDDFGSSLIRNYFGNKSFEFTISDALNTINPITGRPFLNRFKYCPVFVELTDDEVTLYNRITQQIFILKNQENYDEDELQRLYDRRANVCKNAVNKMCKLDSFLDSMSSGDIKDTIMFVSDKQIETVFDITARKGIKRAKITEAESATKIVSADGDTERQKLIAQFSDGKLQVLVGIKCLDEGIDIPNARIAMLLSNSTNPREYVQRVGRVIRQAPDKEESIIYDFIVTPPNGNANGSGILEKEARRAFQIAQNATNYNDVANEFMMRGVNLNAD